MKRNKKYALYRAFSADGRLLYVGSTQQLWQRFRDHTPGSWLRQTATITVQWFDGRGAAAAAERRAIAIERPEWNEIGAPPCDDLKHG